MLRARTRRNNGPGQGVSARLSLAALAFLISVALMLLPAVPAIAADPSPAPTPCPVCLINLTGHWASPVDAGGIDIVQAGSNVRGHSLSGITFTGTLSNMHIGFTFWRGESYAKADSENRGTGSMTVASGGNSLSVTWHSGSGKGVYNGSFVLIKVGPPADSEPHAWGEVIQAIGDAIAPLLPPAASPSPGASPPAALQQVLDAVTPPLNAMTPAQSDEQNGLRDQLIMLRIYDYELDMANLDRSEGKPITPERQARLNAFYNQIRKNLDNTADGLRYPDPPALNTP